MSTRLPGLFDGRVNLRGLRPDQLAECIRELQAELGRRADKSEECPEESPDPRQASKEFWDQGKQTGRIR